MSRPSARAAKESHRIVVNELGELLSDLATRAQSFHRTCPKIVETVEGG